MLKIKHHIFFKKDFKKLVKNGFDDSVLNEVILKPPKQKSQISLVFGMNALVPLGTIKPYE